MIAALVCLALTQWEIPLDLTQFVDAELFARFASQYGVHCLEVQSQAGALIVDCDGATGMKVVRAAEEQLGIRCTKIWPVKILPPEFPSFTVTPPRSGTGASWSAFAPDALIRRAFDQAVREGSASERDGLISCTYVLRPWLTRSLKRTETAAGTFTLDAGGRTRVVPFLLEPEEK